MRHKLALDGDEIPHHFEGLPLRPWLRLAGWPVGLACALLGVVAASRVPWPVVEGLAMLLAACGGMLILGLVRCRRYETVLGSRQLTAGAGPLRRRLPVGLIGELEARPATSWRRLYADHELVVRPSAGERALLIPTADPAELAAALEARPRQ